MYRTRRYRVSEFPARGRSPAALFDIVKLHIAGDAYGVAGTFVKCEEGSGMSESEAA
jgi:hypothetical protein